MKVDTFQGETFTGEIIAINPKVDTGSRNVQVRATLKNADHRLLPGMFATVDIAAGAPQNYITLPQTAITYNPYGNTVYLVTSKGKDADGKPQLIARQTFVTTGATRGDQVAVLKGVEGRRHGRDRRADQAAQRLGRADRQRGAADRRCRAGTDRPLGRRHEIHRHLHPPPGAGHASSA